MMKGRQRQCPKGEATGEDCKVVQTFWCKICKSHIIMEPTMSHVVATKRKILMESDGTPHTFHPWCVKHKQFAITEEKVMEKVQVCPVCRKQFTPQRRGAIYCSNKCRQKATRLSKDTIKRRLESDTFMRRCQAPDCSNPIVGKTSRAKYCSDTCRKRAARGKKKETSRNA